MEVDIVETWHVTVVQHVGVVMGDELAIVCWPMPIARVTLAETAAGNCVGGMNGHN